MKLITVVLSIMFICSCSQFKPKEHFEAVGGECSSVRADGSRDCEWVGYKNLRSDQPPIAKKIDNKNVIGDYFVDGCVGIDATPWCSPNATAEQVTAFTSPVVDDREAKFLKQLKPLIIADTGTTVVGLAKCAVKETNPLLGSNPSPLIVGIYAAIQWKVFEHCAERTPVYASCANDLKIHTIMRYIAVTNNAILLATCL